MRYRVNYRCVVEGQQERMYLEHLAKLVKKFPDIVVTFNISEGNAHELKKSYEEYDKACLFDYDYNKKEFEDNLSICSKLNNEGQKKNKKQRIRVFHAYTNVCFDLWLLLHKTDYFSCVNSNDGYVKQVIKQYDLPDDADIKNKKTIETILSKIKLDDVKMAISSAKEIRNRKIPTDAKKVGNEKYFDNPDLSIHEFIEYVLSKIPQK